jgi:hypothetical protein
MSKSGIPFLTHNALSDDVTQFFECLHLYATEQYESQIYRMCYTAERFEQADGPPPVYPELTDTIQGLVPNPEFAEDQPEGPDNPREIPGLVRKYEVRNGRLTSEGERRLNSDTRSFERDLDKWTKDAEKLDREKCKFHSIIVTHLSASAKRLLQQEFGLDCLQYHIQANGVSGPRLLLDRILSTFGRGSKVGVVRSQVDLLNIQKTTENLKRRDSEELAEFHRRLVAAINTFRQAWVNYSAVTDEQKQERADKFAAKFDDAWAVYIFLNGARVERYEFVLKHEPATHPFPANLDEAVAQAEIHQRSMRDDPLYTQLAMMRRNAFVSTTSPTRNSGGRGHDGKGSAAQGGGRGGGRGGGSTGSTSTQGPTKKDKREPMYDAEGQQVCFSYHDTGVCKFEKENPGLTCRYSHERAAPGIPPVSQRAGGGPANPADVTRAVQQVTGNGRAVTFRDGTKPEK